MEAMILGTPPSPIVSDPPYLPAFLMGGAAPGKIDKATVVRKLNLSSPKRPPSAAVPRSYLHRNSLVASPDELKVTRAKFAPYLDLYDDMPPPAILRNAITCTHNSRQVSPPKVTGYSPNFDRYKSPIDDDTTRLLSSSITGHTPKQDGGDDAEHWITVFGFATPEAVQRVTFYFKGFGDMLEQIVLPPPANYAHFRYATLEQKNSALNANGVLLCPSVLLGVVPFKAPRDCLFSDNECICPKKPDVPWVFENRSAGRTIFQERSQTPNVEDRKELFPDVKSDSLIVKIGNFLFGR